MNYSLIRNTILPILVMCITVGLFVLVTCGSGWALEQPSYHPAFNTPPAKAISRDNYLLEVDVVFTAHLCPPLEELNDALGSRDKNTPLTNVTIAIIDSGIDPSHPELKANLLPGYNFRSGNRGTYDRQGHGTEVAGVAALASGLTCDMDVNGRIMLMPLVVANGRGETSPRILANAIRYAADHGARIINVSYGGMADRDILQDAVDYAWVKGSVVFAAAMNGYHGHTAYPAACDRVVAVTGLGLNSSRSSFANYGDWIDLAADSTLVPTVTRGGGYAAVNGTSFAAPVAAGLGALLLLVNPDLTNTQLVDILTSTAEDLGAPGFDSNFGFGRVSPAKSLKAANADR